MTADNSTNSSLERVLSFNLLGELAVAAQHRPWPSGWFSKLLLKSPDLRLILISMDTGAIMKEHHADGTVAIHCLQGNLRVRVQEQEMILHAGQIVTLTAAIMHSVEAQEDSAFLLTIAWPVGLTSMDLPVNATP